MNLGTYVPLKEFILMTHKEKTSELKRTIKASYNQSKWLFSFILTSLLLEYSQVFQPGLYSGASCTIFSPVMVV